MVFVKSLFRKMLIFLRVEYINKANYHLYIYTSKPRIFPLPSPGSPTVHTGVSTVQNHLWFITTKKSVGLL